MAYTISLGNADDPADVGIRAKDLSQLKAQRFSVPESFVIAASAFERFTEEHKLKYKLDYIMSHIRPEVTQSFNNAYTSARKAIVSEELPDVMKDELKELFDSLTAQGIGITKGKRSPVRMILSPDYVEDPESNDTIIQNIRSEKEFLSAVKEAWALAYLPRSITHRMRENIKSFGLAIIIQVMDEPIFCSHGYSSLPEDRKKLFLQTYYGQLDLREKVTKDYYALGKDTLDVLLDEIREQPEILEYDEKQDLVLSPLSSKTAHDRINKRDVQEVGRLTKKVEKVLQAPVKAFFASKDERHTLLWVNRLGFDIMAKQENIEIVEIDEPSGDEKLGAELKMVRQFVERRFREEFEDRPMGSLAGMLAQLNHIHAFERNVDSRLLGYMERKLALDEEITPEERRRALEEITYLMEHS